VAQGTVKWFDEKKGYGFISEDGPDVAEYFVHFSAIQGGGFKKLAEGDRVSFEPARNEKGEYADKVVKL